MTTGATITWDEYLKRELPMLEEILALRLRYSREWDNVELVVGKRTMKIRWISPKTQPEAGDNVFSERRIAPFNAETLGAEKARQLRKLLKEQADNK